MQDVRAMLELAGITQADASQALGVSQPAMSAYVNGSRRMPPYRVDILVRMIADRQGVKQAQANTIANVADKEAEAEQAATQPDTRPIGRLWWSSHSRQGLDAHGEFIWAPIPAPYPGGPPLYESFPVYPPVTRPPAGMVHMFDHDLNQWLIEPDPV